MASSIRTVKERLPGLLSSNRTFPEKPPRMRVLTSETCVRGAHGCM